MKLFKGWTSDDFFALFFGGLICICLLLLFLLGAFKVASKIDCEWRPTTERCTVLDSRDRPGAYL